MEKYWRNIGIIVTFPPFSDFHTPISSHQLECVASLGGLRFITCSICQVYSLIEKENKRGTCLELDMLETTVPVELN